MFNLDHNQTALAQAVYGVTDSSIVEISASATGIPALSGVAASSTSTPGSGSTNGGGTSGSNSKSWGISGGTIAGIVIGVLILIGVVGMVAFMGIQKRRAARREPETEDPTRTPKAKTHEVPGKDHEIKKEVATQDNKSELPEDEISKSNVRGITAKSYEVQENELLPQNNKAELPEDRHGIGEIVLHRKLETSAQYNQHELSGSSEHPVEAPSATYSPAHAELDSYGAISPDQFEAAALPELPAEPMQRKPLPAQSSVSRISGVSIPDSQLHGAPGSEAGRAGSSDMGNVTGGPSKVDILQERFERFRAEKERLAKTGELEEMETALQQEIMTELRKEHGSDGRLS